MFAVVMMLCLSFGGDPVSAVSDGDAAFYRIDYSEAARCYQQGLQTSPGDRELLWRLARVSVCMAEVEEDAAQRKVLLQQGEDAARRCIALDSSRAEGHTWLAGALGYRALDAGMGEQVKISQELVVETAAAIGLDPTNDAAWSIRGSFYRALGNVGWVKRQLAAMLLGTIPEGGFPEAETALTTAIRLAPDIMRHHYELGVLYLDMDRKEDARLALRKAAVLEIRTAIDTPRREKALKLLRDLEEE